MSYRRGPIGKYDLGLQFDQFGRGFSVAASHTRGPAGINMYVLALCPAQTVQSPEKGTDALLPLDIIGGRIHEHRDAAHPLTLLRMGHQRPRCRSSEQADEPAPSHSITSSARASSVGGTIIPSAFAVFKLITSSNLISCSTGRSAGFAPLTILST